MKSIKYLVRNVDMLTKEKFLENSNKYKVLFLKYSMRAPEIYLDVLIIDNYEIPKEIQEEKAPREIQSELRSFC